MLQTGAQRVDSSRASITQKRFELSDDVFKMPSRFLGILDKPALQFAHRLS
jgi:hypothetical protein